MVNPNKKLHLMPEVLVMRLVIIYGPYAKNFNLRWLYKKFPYIRTLITLIQ